MATQGDPQLGPFLRGLLRAEADEAAEGADVPSPDADQRLAAAMVVRFGSRRRGRPAWALAAYSLAAAAAAAALILLLPRLFTPSVIALNYELTLRPVSDTMGTAVAEPAGRPLRPGDTLEIQLRPRRATSREVALRAFVRDGAGYEEWPVSFQRFAGGALALRRRIAELPPLPRGQLELVVVLCSGRLPASAELLRQLAASSRLADDCQRLEAPLVLSGP